MLSQMIFRFLLLSIFFPSIIFSWTFHHRSKLMVLKSVPAKDLWIDNNFKDARVTTSAKCCNHHLSNTKLYMSKSSTTGSTSAINTDSKGSGVVQVIHQPDERFLVSKGVYDWPTWGCSVSKFPWSYSDSETCYIIKGKVIVTVTPKPGQEQQEAITISAGDYVTFPSGLSCTWDVVEAIEKHYMFG